MPNTPVFPTDCVIFGGLLLPASPPRFCPGGFVSHNLVVRPRGGRGLSDLGAGLDSIRNSFSFPTDWKGGACLYLGLKTLGVGKNLDWGKPLGVLPKKTSKSNWSPHVAFGFSPDPSQTSAAGGVGAGGEAPRLPSLR